MKIFQSTLKSTLLIKEFFHVLGLLGAAYFVYTGMYMYLAVAVLWGMFLVLVLHEVAMHRYFSHNSFKTNKFWHVFLCLTVPLLNAGSPISYAIHHRAHHAHSDTDLDVHAPGLGFWNVAMVRWNYQGVNLKCFTNLKDPWIIAAHRWYFLIIAAFCGIMLMIDPLLLFAYGISCIYTRICAVSTNYFCHIALPYFNYRNFDTKDRSYNNLLNGWLVGGWHNNHHANPSSCTQKVHWWEWDTPALVIRMIKK